MPGLSSDDEDRRAIALLGAFECLEQGGVAQAREQCEALLGQNGGDADALYVLAMAEARSGDLESAARRLSRVATLQPKLPPIHHQLANVYQDQGKLDRAIASYRRAIRLKRDLAEPHNDLGTAYYAKGWVDEAVASYRRAVRYDPLHAVAHANLGGALRKKGDLRGARKHLKAELRLRLRNAGTRWLERLRKRKSVAITAEALGARAGFFALQGHATLAAAAAEAAIRRDAEEPWALYVLASERHAGGAFDEALSLARRSANARQAPDHRRLLALGQLLAQLGHPAEAIAVLRKALAAHRRDSRTRYGLGLLLLDKGDMAEARLHLEKALRLNPESVATRVALGRIEKAAGRLDAAEKLIDAALQVEPDDVDALLWLGEVWRAQDRFEEAQVLYLRIAGLPLERVGDWYRLALGMREAGLYEDALKCFEKALEIEPDSPVALSNQGLILTDLGKPREAIAVLRKALERNPEFADAMLNLGRALHYAEEYQEAARCYEEAKRLRPGWALPLTLEGTSYESQGLFAKAEQCYRESLRLAPDDASARVNLAHMRLISGDLGEGWDLYESRQNLEEYRSIHKRLTVPRWDGSPLQGKSIAVYAEQGLGDEINFASCLPDLLRLSPARVLLTCGTQLEAIFRRTFPEVEVQGGEPKAQTAWLRGLNPKPDFQVAIGSLHRFFRRSLDEFPSHRGYLSVDSSKVARWRDQVTSLGPGAKIGLSWKGGIIKTGELRRTLQIEQLLPLLRLPGLHFVSLQYTDCRKDLETLRSRHGVSIAHWQEAIDDYDQTAALVATLDLVVSVCTAVVHLAGALNTPAWVMAPIGPHWRYAMPEGRMPWYPGVTVFRQQRFGEWDEVIERVRGRLAATFVPADTA